MDSCIYIEREQCVSGFMYIYRERAVRKWIHIYIEREQCVSGFMYIERESSV